MPRRKIKQKRCLGGVGRGVRISNGIVRKSLNENLKLSEDLKE